VTLIAIACKGDTAEYVADSLSYSRSFRYTGHTAKSVVYHHIDAAVLAQGDSDFGSEVWTLFRRLTDAEPTFDAAVQRAPGVLREACEAVAQACGWSDGHPRDARVFFVGYSEAEGRFVSWGFFRENDFEALRLPDMFILPTPWGLRPNAFELEEPVESEDAEWNAWAEGVLTEWRDRPEPTVPADRDEWGQLVNQARGRAITELRRHPLGGKVFHTELSQGGMSFTTPLMEFDRTPQSRLELVGYTLHPLAQVRPCHCDSGRRYIECHLVEEFDDPCRCESGQPLRECCLLNDEDARRLGEALDVAI